MMQNYNQIHSLDDIYDESGDRPYLVSLDEVKDYLRLEGFQDVDESDSTVFTDDDDLIEDIIIPAATEYLEQAANISLRVKKLEVLLTNYAGRIELPYSPIDEIVSLKDCEGNDITDYKVIGNNQKYLVYPCYSDMTIVYTTKALGGGLQKLDLLRMCSYLFQNRDDDEGSKQYANQLVKAYSRISWLI